MLNGTEESNNFAREKSIGRLDIKNTKTIAIASFQFSSWATSVFSLFPLSFSEDCPPRFVDVADALSAASSSVAPAPTDALAAASERVLHLHSQMH